MIWPPAAIILGVTSTSFTPSFPTLIPIRRPSRTRVLPRKWSFRIHFDPLLFCLPSTYMHPCLEVHELLTTIFLYLTIEDRNFGTTSSTTESPPLNLPSLAILARTCKAFCEPALDILWRTQSALLPLVRTLPQSALYREGRTNWKLARDLGPEDYDRVVYYGRRIKSLGISKREHSGHIPRLDQALLSVFWSRRPILLLLPNLVYFKFTLEDCARMCVYPRLAMGPTVKSVVLVLTEIHHPHSSDRFVSGYPWNNVKAVIAPSASALENFTIQTSQQYEPVDFGSPPQILDIYRSFDCLQSLDARCIQLTSDVLSRLATLTGLQNLTITISDSEFMHFLSTDSSDTDFLNLRKLSIETRDLDLCSELFCRPGFGRLQTIAIVRRSGPNVWDLDSFFEVLRAQRARFRSLSSLSLAKFDDFRSLGDPPSNVSTITPKTLTPLFTFASMVEVRVDLDGRVELDDTCIIKIANFWPHLRVLELSDRSLDMTPNTTLVGLLPLIASCPNLEELSIRVNAQPKLMFAEIGDIIGGKNIRRLDLCTSPIEEPDDSEIAVFLPLAFPRLSHLSYGRSGSFDNEVMERRWDKVYTSMEHIMRGTAVVT